MLAGIHSRLTHADVVSKGRPSTVIGLLFIGALAWAVPSPATAADRDCSDFGSQAAAQSFFLNNGGPGRDRHGLDPDDDGVACEGKGAPYLGVLSVHLSALGGYDGTLKAAVHRCQSGRTIRVYKKRAGPDELIGTDTTRNDGEYFAGADAHGRIYSKAPAEGQCRKDRSFKTLRL